MAEGREGVALSYQDSAAWEQMQDFDLFSSVDSLDKLKELVASNTREGSPFRAKFERLSGLAVFLERYCSHEERDTFFSSTLRFIIHSASCLKERVPETGIPLLQAQESACVGLGRYLVVSLLANAFLCTLPGSQDQENEGRDCLFSFASFYHQLKMDTDKAVSVAALLKCCLAYFHSLDQWRVSLGGSITFRRQGLPLGEEPSLSLWKACQLPLCALTLSSSGGFEDADFSSTLQVDLASFCASGIASHDHSLMGEPQYCMYPELLVSRLILEPLRDNEAVLINGVQRFVPRGSSGESQQYVGESGDRDVHGNVPTSVVAIDAVPFLEPLSPEQQYTERYLLREANKAFAGFLCHSDTEDGQAEPITCHPGEDSSQIFFYCGGYSSGLPTDPSSQASAASQLPTAQTETSEKVAESTATKSGAVETETAAKPSTQMDSLVSSIVRSGVEMVTSGGGGATGKGGKERVEEFAGSLSGSILSSVLSDKPHPTASGPTLSDSMVIDLKSDFHHSSNTKKFTAATTTADVLAQSIIGDVLSQDRTVPSPPPPSSPQTVGQPTSPAIEWQVHSFADKMSDNILSDVLSGSEAPPFVVKRSGESGSNSQSSSVTGQTITLHEFTDDLVEGVVREGLLIARLQARATERETDVERDEGLRGGGRGGGVGGKFRESGQGASDVADRVVAESIRSVFEDAKRKREERSSEREKPELRPFSGVGGASRRSESPMRSSAKPGLLRQALEKPKHLIPVLPESDANDFEHSTMSSLLHLSAPSSRMSYAWSVASTRDEGSRPVSPTDLDRMALSFVCSVEEFCSLFVELVIRGAIADVTGNRKYMCHVPVKSHHNSHDSLTADGDVRMLVPTVGHRPPTSGEAAGESLNTTTPSRMDAFLSTLDEAEPVEGEEEEEEEGGEGEFPLRSRTVDKGLLRKVATGNWGCGQMGGDPQLKCMLQWVAVSASGHSEMIYLTNHDQRMEPLAAVVAHIKAKQWRVGQLVSALMEYCHLNLEERESKSLFSFLLDK